MPRCAWLSIVLACIALCGNSTGCVTGCEIFVHSKLEKGRTIAVIPFMVSNRIWPQNICDAACYGADMRHAAFFDWAIAKRLDWSMSLCLLAADALESKGYTVGRDWAISPLKKSI